MDSLVYLQHSSGLSGTSFTSRGGLTLRQRNSIGYRDNFSTLYVDDLLLEIQEATMSASEANVKKILERYESRAFTTKCGMVPNLDERSDLCR